MENQEENFNQFILEQKFLRLCSIFGIPEEESNTIISKSQLLGNGEQEEFKKNFSYFYNLDNQKTNNVIMGLSLGGLFFSGFGLSLSSENFKKVALVWVLY